VSIQEMQLQGSRSHCRNVWCMTAALAIVVDIDMMRSVAGRGPSVPDPHRSLSRLPAMSAHSDCCCCCRAVVADLARVERWRSTGTKRTLDTLPHSPLPLGRVISTTRSSIYRWLELVRSIMATTSSTSTGYGGRSIGISFLSCSAVLSCSF